MNQSADKVNSESVYPARPKRFAPEDIFPAAAEDGVRVNGTALRDWQQSVASGSESSQHMSRVAPQLNAFHKGLKYPGAEEVGGGTVPRMDMSVRNEYPAEHVAKLKALLPDVPLMALIRSDAGAGMEEISQDVLQKYLINYHKAGIDVFRNFHALNKPRAFIRVARALHEAGKVNGTQPHLQAAYSFATYEKDPAIYNPRTPVTFFKKLFAVLREAATQDGLDENAYLPSSLVIKDPSGVLTPEMAKFITQQVKADEELSKLPFGIHTHNQMGHAADTCKAAVDAGANFVDCAPTPGGFGAQPPMPAMVETLGGESGKALGFDNTEAFEAAKQRLQNVDHLSTAILKSHDPDVRQSEPDATVPNHCIAGGQSSIARAEVKKELQKMGNDTSKESIEAFMQKAKNLMPDVRKELGSIVLVTPTADYIFREAMYRALGRDPDKGFYCGYRRIMTGEMGSTPEPVDPVKQKQALLERLEARLVRSLTADDKLHDGSAEDKERVKNLAAGIKKAGNILKPLRDVMLEESLPVRRRERMEQINARMDELEHIKNSGNKDLLAFMGRQLGMENNPEKAIGLVLANLHIQREGLNSKMLPEPQATAKIDLYNEFLKTRTEDIAERVRENQENDSLVQYYKEILDKVCTLKVEDLPAEAKIRLIKSASYTSLPMAELLPEKGMDSARRELQELAEKGDYKKPEDTERFELDAMWGRMLRDPYRDDPDAVAREYYKRRDGLGTPTPVVDVQKHPFHATATFAQPVPAHQLESDLADALIKNQRWDSAANLMVSPGEKGAEASQSFTLSLPKIDNPAEIGIPHIHGVIEAHGGMLSGAAVDRYVESRRSKMAKG